MKSKKTASILKKFLLFNLTTFSILGLFTIFYLKAIQPNLVKQRSEKHKIIINNINTKYTQLFEEKNGFLYDLSILDLLFNCGPNTLDYI